MKLQQSGRRRGQAFATDSFSLSWAKTYLGRLLEKAGNGEDVYIVTGSRRFLLQEVPTIDPIPIRPPGYFARCYSEEVIDGDNELAKSSVRSAPRDLE